MTAVTEPDSFPARPGRIRRHKAIAVFFIFPPPTLFLTHAFCARTHSLMESSVWHGREQEVTNSLQDWTTKTTIKVGS
ncbi:protein of unknown function [Desulfovibrio sp. 86]|nr:protein of unknown function [Desulfovibrio sp. 86]